MRKAGSQALLQAPSGQGGSRATQEHALSKESLTILL